MGQTVVRITNQALIKEVLGETWEFQSQDGDSFEEFQPVISPATFWVAIADEKQVRGVALANSITQYHGYAHIAFRKAELGKTALNTEAGKLCIQWVWHNTTFHKLSAMTYSPVVLAYDQRIGFKREGISRQSWLKNGQWHDQYILGINKS